MERHADRVMRAVVVCVAGVVGLVTACTRERAPAPGSQASPAPAGRRDLTADAYRVEWGEVGLPAVLSPGERVEVPVTVTNASPVSWPASGRGGLYVVRLSHRWLRTDGEQVSAYGTRTDLPAPLAPQQSITLTAAVVAPSAPGEYTVQFDLVHEGVAWFASRGATKMLVPVRVR